MSFSSNNILDPMKDERVLCVTSILYDSANIVSQTNKI